MMNAPDTMPALRRARQGGCHGVRQDAPRDDSSHEGDTMKLKVTR